MVINAIYLLLISYLGLNPVSYFTQGGNTCPDYQTDTIKIGLLIQDNKSTAAAHGAEMAINKSNLFATRSGRYFKLETRNMEGPWGTGAKETVNLVFGEDVWAVIGSVDGRNSHLAEQVSAKTHIPFISAWSGDPTLAQAFIPWYFSCVPNDLQQAAVIIGSIHKRNGSGKIVIVSDDSYDSRMAAGSFVKRAVSEGKPEPAILYYDTVSGIPGDIAGKIKKESGSCLVIFGQKGLALKLINELRKAKINCYIFGSLLMFGEKEFTGAELEALGGTTLVSPGYLFGKQGKDFSHEFFQLHGYKPGAAAAFSYDAVNLILDAIKNAGNDRSRLKECIAGIKHEGITGQIVFDAKGNRAGNASLMKIENNRPVPLFY